MNARTGLLHGIREDEIWPCRLLMLICFAALLPIAVVARLSGWRWQPWPSGPDGYESIFRESLTMATTIAGTVFSS